MARRFNVSRKVISSDGVAVPTLSKSESTLPGTTIYVKLDLQIKETPPEAGIFIPDGFDLGSHIDLLLYMRGFKIADEIVSVESYFKQSYGKLREGVNSSGRNVILVAPALGPNSQAGSLVKPGGLDSFLGQALAAVLKHGGLANPPSLLTLGHLIIACHSGGGAPVRKMAGGSDEGLANLRECWGYDSLYHDADVPFWSAWARAKTNDKLLLYYLPTGTPAQRCKELAKMKLRNLIAQESSAPDHMHVPITQWGSNLKGANFVAMRSGSELVA
jgi:hypothetical protein